VHRNSLRNWESGERDISAECLVALHRVGYNTNWVLTGQGPERLDALGSSQAVKLDEATLRKSLEILKWAFQIQGAVYDATRDPDLLAMTYDYLIEEDPVVATDKSNVHDFLKRLAERRAGGANDVQRATGRGPGRRDPGPGSGTGG
jgi:hypothetical protein